jgi:hypothetical protein
MKTAPGQAKVCYPRTPSLATERLARSRVQASQMRCDRFPRNYPAKKRRIACHIRSISSWIDPASLPMFGLIVQKKKKSKIFLQQKNRRPLGLPFSIPRDVCAPSSCCKPLPNTKTMYLAGRMPLPWVSIRCRDVPDPGSSAPPAYRCQGDLFAFWAQSI